MIMTGSSRRTPGLAGKLGLAIVAGGLLPVGASWAQKPDEAKQERVVVTTDDTVDGIGLTARVDSSDPENRDGRAASAPNSKHAVVVLRADADAQGDRGVTFEGPVEVHQMELAGPLAGAMKELEAEIVRLKKQGESSDDARQRVKGLVAALDTLKKIGAPPHTMTLRMIGDGEKLGDPKRAQVRFIAKVQKPGTPGEKSEEIGKARKEVEALEGELKAAVERLVKAQARLRELGGDPGGTPNVMWRRSARLQGPVVEKRVTLFRDGEVRTLGPKDVRVEARFGPDKEAAASDQRRLEKLEGRLKALQDEVDRLKKDSKGRGEKE